MANLSRNLSTLQQACINPHGRLERYLEQGKKIVEYFPYYAPEELVHAYGMIPMGIWSGQAGWKLARRYLPALACLTMQPNMEFGLRGTYGGMSAVIIPAIYDTLCCTTQSWRFGVLSIPMIPIAQPQNRTSPASVDYLISEFETALAMLHAIAGRMISEAVFGRTIQIYNEHNAVMREFSAVAARHLDMTTPEVRHTVMRSASFYGKHEHTAIVCEIVSTLKQRPGYSHPGKKIVLSGIACEPDELLDILAGNQSAVAEDDLAQEMRRHRTDIPLKGGDSLKRLALQWGNRRSCSLTHVLGKPQGSMMIDLCRETGIEGVILCTIKFCDPEEYDEPYLEADLRQTGIPSLSIEVDQQNGSFKQLRTRLQTFQDMM